MSRVPHYIAKGLIGIASNPHLSFIAKLNLFFDYFRLLFLALQTPFRPKLSDSRFDKVFYTKAYNYHIYYPVFPSFFFLFNEIFCICEYKAVSNLKNYIDAGANIGLTILWYHFFSPKMTIYAFEPDDSTFKFLQKNIEAARINHCSLFKKAVSNKTKLSKFYHILDPVRNVGSGLELKLKLPFITSKVNTQKLSALIKRVGNVSLVKIDIEGEEYNVFEDLISSKTLTNINKFIFESHVVTKKDCYSYTKILKFLQKIGKIKSQRTSEYTSMNYWERARMSAKSSD